MDLLWCLCLFAYVDERHEICYLMGPSGGKDRDLDMGMGIEGGGGGREGTGVLRFSFVCDIFGRGGVSP